MDHPTARPSSTPIPAELLDRIMVYLGARPYQEVARLISDLATAHNAARLEHEAQGPLEPGGPYDAHQRPARPSVIGAGDGR